MLLLLLLLLICFFLLLFLVVVVVVVVVGLIVSVFVLFCFLSSRFRISLRVHFPVPCALPSQEARLSQPDAVRLSHQSAASAG